ncbi:MAG TPA: penicillin-binding protein, partial [Pseudomonas sp.]|nr:penicillin-binding protein [Pseudomonas sp.]
MKIIRQATTILLLGTALPALGGIYSYTDAEGNRVFTDRPSGQAVEEVQLKPSNSMASQPTPAPRAV